MIWEFAVYCSRESEQLLHPQDTKMPPQISIFFECDGGKSLFVAQAQNKKQFETHILLRFVLSSTK